MEKLWREQLEEALDALVPYEGKMIAVYGIEEESVGDSPDALHNFISPEYFIEDDPSKCGTTHCGKPVISFEEAHTKCRAMFILVHGSSRQIVDKRMELLQKDPIQEAEIRAVNIAEIIFCKNREKVLAVYDMLNDDFSKQTYAHMILVRMKKAAPSQEILCPNQYFGVPIFAEPFEDEVFVDCGAFVGDTIEQYLWPKVGIFKKIYAFEPFDRTFKALSARVDRLKREWSIPDSKIELIHGAVGESIYQLDAGVEGKHIEEDRNLSDYYLGGAAKTKDNGIPVYTIDKYFANEKISFLKADIEGFEWAMLAGGRKVIKRDKPKIAICIYHLHVDMFRIPLKLKQLCPDYKFSVRQHAFRMFETVLYAYIERT